MHLRSILMSKKHIDYSKLPHTNPLSLGTTTKCRKFPCIIEFWAHVWVHVQKFILINFGCGTVDLGCSGLCPISFSAFHCEILNSGSSAHYCKSLSHSNVKFSHQVSSWSETTMYAKTGDPPLDFIHSYISFFHGYKPHVFVMENCSEILFQVCIYVTCVRICTI